MTDYEKLSRTFDELKIKYDCGGYNDGSFIAVVNKYQEKYSILYFVFDENEKFVKTE